MSEIQVGDLSVELTQEMDCCESGDFQSIKINAVDGGGGPYIVIETERWAIDDPSAFADMLRKWLATVEEYNK